MDIPSSDRVYFQNLFNQLREKQLDDRESTLNFRFTVVSVIATVFGLLVAIAGVYITMESQDIKREIQDTKREIQDVKSGKYTEIPTHWLIPVTVASGQINQEELTTFIRNAHTFFSTNANRESYKSGYDQEDYKQRDIKIEGGGAVQLWRTHNKQEFLAAWDGVLKVLKALKDGEDLPGIKILVRGTERFFDIKGIGGVGGRTWIAFDLR